MDPGDLIPAGLDPAAATVLGRYLRDLDAALPARRKVRTTILAEIVDGLTCAVTDATGHGIAAGTAARTAVADSGDPATVAAAFAAQLGPAAAHRLGAGLLTSGPLVGLLWVAAYRGVGPDWPARIASVLATMPWYPLILAVTAPAAALAIGGAGRAARHLAVAPRWACAAGLIAAAGCVAGDMSLLSAAVTGHRLAAPGPAGLLVAAATLSAVRLCVAVAAGRRLARLWVAGR